MLCVIMLFTLKENYRVRASRFYLVDQAMSARVGVIQRCVSGLPLMKIVGQDVKEKTITFEVWLLQTNPPLGCCTLGIA